MTIVYWSSFAAAEFEREEKIMSWFKDSNGHILESKNRMHRLLYCPLCKKLISKADCQKLRHSDKNGSLYIVKRYHYDKSSKIERAERKEEKEGKRLLEFPNVELNKIVKNMSWKKEKY